jgi:hypothetical protein
MTPLDPRTVARLGLLYRYRADGALRWLEATGISMQPILPPGSRLLVDFGRKDVQVGEIALFERRDMVVAHRIVATRGHGAGLALIPKGDGERYPDAAIRPDDVLGVVRQVQRPDGHDVRAALGGSRGALVAHVSWWSSRADRVANRMATRAPSPVRPVMVASARSLSRIPIRVITASMSRH